MTAFTPEETELHIFKRRMGLTKRGSRDNEALTLSDVSVNQTDNFTVHETREFVTLIITTAQILQTKVSADKKTCLNYYQQFTVRVSLECKTSKPGFLLKTCGDRKQFLQPFYRVDVVLTFKETNHKTHWTMENTLPCTGECAADDHSKIKVVIYYRMIF